MVEEGGEGRGASPPPAPKNLLQQPPGGSVRGGATFASPNLFLGGSLGEAPGRGLGGGGWAGEGRGGVGGRRRGGVSAGGEEAPLPFCLSHFGPKALSSHLPFVAEAFAQVGPAETGEVLGGGGRGLRPPPKPSCTPPVWFGGG